MSKVLTDRKLRKRFPRKLTDLLSMIVILLTVAALGGAALLSHSYNSKSMKVTSSAIYKGKDDQKKIALMFNVYEHAENVMTILAILRKYSAKATFFIGGIWAEKNPETLLEIKHAGQEIGCHGYLHRDHSKMTIEQNKEEIGIACRLIQNVTGEKVRLFAPPSGAFGKNTEIACQELGQKLILWSKDTIDWRDREVSLLVKRATSKPKNGDLILLHPMEQTVRALPQIIEFYQTAGFELATVGEIV